MIPGGCKIPVTEQNKMKYLDVMAQYRLHTRVSDEIDAFLKGIWILIFIIRNKSILTLSKQEEMIELLHL